jgi:hypothetical protein
MTADEIRALFNLEPHPREGGFFAETWKSEETIPVEALPSRYRASRLAGTAIYYLLDAGGFSEIHRLASDEVFHFYYGDPVEMLQLSPDGTGRTILLGNDLEQGMKPQVVAPKGVWQGSRLVPGGKVALLGCTVSPGFDYADYEAGSRVELLHRFPQYREHIEALTRVEAFGLF